MADKFDDFNVEAPNLTFDVEEAPVDTVSDKIAEAEAQIADMFKEADVVDIPIESVEIVEAAPAAAPIDPAETLTEKEMQQVREFVKKIDINNTQAIMNYGAGTQKKIADFSEKALENVKTKDMGEVGTMITSLVGELKHFDEEEKKGIFGFFKKKANNIENLKAKYNKVETNVTEIKNALEERQVLLMKDSAMLDRMYELNLNYFRELTMYISLQVSRSSRKLRLQTSQSSRQKPKLPDFRKMPRQQRTLLLSARDLRRSSMTSNSQEQLLCRPLRRLEWYRHPTISWLRRFSQRLLTRFRSGRTRWLSLWVLNIPFRQLRLSTK